MNNAQLQQLVEQTSMQFFNRPFLHRATFNNRLRTTGGRYLLSTHDIEINKKQYDAFGESALVDIIKHELCHYHLHLRGLGYRHRDKDFKQLSKAVGAPRHCDVLPDEERKQIHYLCIDCGQRYIRKRKIDLNKYRCGKCHGKLQQTRKT